MTTAKPNDLPALLAAVEQAWIKSYRGADTDGNGRITLDAITAVNALCTALRADGSRVCVVSREAVEALRRMVTLHRFASEAMCADGGQAQRTSDDHDRYTLELLARDLDAVLKADGG